MTVSVYPITEVDLEHYRGDTFSRTVRAELDLTGYTVQMQVRETEDSKKILADISNGNGIVINEITANSTTMTLSIPHEVTQKLVEGELRYDLQMVQGDYVRTILRGAFIVTGDVTK